MSVQEYEKKFNQLSRYAPHLVDTEERKVRRFEKNLRPEISSILAGQGTNTYAEVLAKAHEISSRLKLEEPEKSIMDQQNKRKWIGPQQGKTTNNKKQARKGEGPTQHPKQLTTTNCPKCGKPHSGECLYRTGICYNCKEPGHIVTNCPKLQGKQGKTPARVFAMTHQEAAENPEVMAGMLNISNIPALVLFDTGATHSFISRRLFDEIKAAYPIIEKEFLEVSIPSGSSIQTMGLCKKVRINFDHLNLNANLHIVEMKDFDVILGMDWLSANHAVIRCREKEILIQKSEGEETGSCVYYSDTTL
ncbi:hypothetical protein OROMI_006485 [Orobanche minor]